MNRLWVTNVLLSVIAFLLFLNLLPKAVVHASAENAVKYEVVPLKTQGASQGQIEAALYTQGWDGWQLLMKCSTPDGDVLIFRK
ncbi:MAG: hypothetical protein ACLPZY_16190 [Terracidiphilus sp.]